VGLASAAAPFLPVSCTAGRQQLPGGPADLHARDGRLVLAFFVGRFLQTRRKIVALVQA